MEDGYSLEPPGAPDQAAPRNRPRSREEMQALENLFMAWELLEPETRDLQGQPQNQSAWGRRYHVADATISRWRTNPDYVKRKRDLMLKRASRDEVKIMYVGNEDATGAPDDKGKTNAEMMVDILRQQLTRAAAGDKSALDFIKAPHISKPLIDTIMAQVETDFPGLSDDKLCEMFVDAYPGGCYKALKKAGYLGDRSMFRKDKGLAPK